MEWRLVRALLLRLRVFFLSFFLPLALDLGQM